MIVTAEQRRQFDEDGYLVFDPEVPEGLLEGVVADLEGKYPERDTEPGASWRDPRRISNAWRMSENVRALALAPRVLALLQELYGRKPLPFQTLNFLVGTQQRPHSDAFHFNSQPPGYMCGVWVALEDTDMENGPLMYYPGSHKLPELSVGDVDRAVPPRRGLWMTALSKAPALYSSPALRRVAAVRRLFYPRKPELYPRYEQVVAGLIEAHRMKPFYGLVRKGQAILWSSNILHGGAPVADPRRTRHSQVTHYFFEGCRYYTPLYSDRGWVEWREPVWIR